MRLLQFGQYRPWKMIQSRSLLKLPLPLWVSLVRSGYQQLVEELEYTSHRLHLDIFTAYDFIVVQWEMQHLEWLSDGHVAAYRILRNRQVLQLFLYQPFLVDFLHCMVC